MVKMVFIVSAKSSAQEKDLSGEGIASLRRKVVGKGTIPCPDGCLRDSNFSGRNPDDDTLIAIF